MAIEYILLLSIFVLFLMKVIYTGPNDAFKNAGPKLGARVEKHLITGDRFSLSEGKAAVDWKEK